MANVIAKTESEKTAFWCGFGAHRDGADRDANPHAAALVHLRECWFGGWTTAWLEKAKSPNGKKLRGSRTFWFGIVVIVLAVLGYFQTVLPIEQYPELATCFTATIGFMTIILRCLTGRPIAPFGGANYGYTPPPYVHTPPPSDISTPSR